MAGYAIASLDQIYEVDADHPFRAVRHHFGITTFGVNAMTGAAAGDQVIKEHAEDEPGSSEELYVVISGNAEFSLDDETVEAPAGSFVHVATGVKRSAVAKEPGTTVVVIGGAPPGQAYRPNGWELFAPLFKLFETGEYERGADLANEMLAGDPPYGVVYYNTACFEARAGRTADALTHLRRALELSPDLTDLARDDNDLASVRDEPEFVEIVGPAG